MSTKTQLQKNNTELNKILTTAQTLPTQESVKNGLYVWKKRTAIDREFVSYITSNNQTEYPDGGILGDFWYELYGSPIPIVSWADGADGEIVDMVKAADEGKITLSDYWAVGQERKVHLSAMPATHVGENHAEETVTMVLMHVGDKVLANGKTCNFIVGQKNTLVNVGYMNSSDTVSGGWNACARRKWCNDVYYNSIPATLRPIFKQHKNITANGRTSTVVTSIDYFAFPAEKEIFGANKHANSSTEKNLFQFEYYKTASNRVKKKGDIGDDFSQTNWWERSVYDYTGNYFCMVSFEGYEDYITPTATRGLAPFGCI